MTDMFDAQLASLLQREGLADPTWLCSLDEFDEPPLFSRSADVEFLRALPGDDRGVLVLGWAVAVLDRAGMLIESLPSASSYFLCLTLMDWDLVADGTQAVPTPSLFVSPQAPHEVPRLGVRSPVTAAARQVSSWLARLDREDLCVRDDLELDAGAPVRVYVGYRSRRAFRSLPDVAAP